MGFIIADVVDTTVIAYLAESEEDVVTRFFKFYIGKYKKLTFVVKDKATGVPIDITGNGFTFTIKRTVTDADGAALVHKTTVDGITLSDPTHGAGFIEIPASDTSTLPIVDQDIVWDLQRVVSGNGSVIADGTGRMLVPVLR